ncbi:hypothetical protein VNO78_13222 [Psophocarpus tetragonolobus]|uniref:Uncharacterized protein n=1 Tax=Psophocarpus tetragonolobus TaxID=3891 RepID=A0AAN9SYQ0_PSOTE
MMTTLEEDNALVRTFTTLAMSQRHKDHIVLDPLIGRVIIGKLLLLFEYRERQKRSFATFVLDEAVPHFLLNPIIDTL